MRRQILLALVLGLVLLPLTAGAQTKLLRFPDLHGDRVVFTYAGDLWVASTVTTGGGTARRLTAHPGLELFARFSPDGEWIAFTGQYDGDEQVYVIPAAGGEPRQLTWYPARGPLPPRWGYDNQVYDWSADGRSILFRSLRYSADLADPRLFLVPVDGGLPTPLPMPEAGAGDLSPDGASLVYSPLFRDFRTWKRYQGGWAQELYTFRLSDHALRRITDNPRADRDPMWIGDRIVFASDRDGKMNLYSVGPTGGEPEQLTHETLWDVRWPSDDGVGRVVYELDGELEVLDLASGESRHLSIEVLDDGLARRSSHIEVAQWIESFELSPKGERALFVARGDVFTAPIEKGPTRNLTQSSDAHDQRASWSPDGTMLAFVSDRTGEEEIWLVPQDGSAAPHQLTRGSVGKLYDPRWSPDGDRIAVSDKDGRIWVVDAKSGAQTEVADEARGQVFDYSWSPHGGHLAFSLSDETDFRSLYLWSAADGQLRRVTGPDFNETEPVWSPDGQYLFFLSDRDYAPQIDGFEWNYALDRTTGIFALALRRDVPHPFPPESDEVSIGDEEGDKVPADDPDSGKKGKKGKKPDEAPAPAVVKIDFDGLAERVARVPVTADNLAGLSAVEGYLVYLRVPPFYYGRDADFEPELRIFSLEDREESTLASGVGGYALSADGAKILVAENGSYRLYDAKPGASDPGTVSTAGLVMERIPAEEWRTIFDEVWRRYRDFFYAENMHGYDWEGLREQYRPWLDHVAHRSDLNYVIGEMISELSVGHAYISGGDFEIPERPRYGLAGARFELDPEAGRYRITEVLPGDNAEERYRSPLTEIGVEVREGDYLLAIDGEELAGTDNPYRLLRYHDDRPVEWTVNDRPTLEGARKASYRPVTSETSLEYLKRVEHNRARVEELGGGRLGYLHIPDMGSSGIQEFIKHYYSQIRKVGLVIDVRGNGGGNVSPMILERLGRKVLGTRFIRTFDTPRAYPIRSFYGHLVCLLDEDSASDGDIFPSRFRTAGLGPLIGKRSWGGVVGITYHGPLLDGGDVRVPQFGTNDLQGNWIIEGTGVTPDIEVDNPADALLEGRDPQLERGVAELLRKLDAEPRKLPERPADPVKTE